MRSSKPPIPDRESGNRAVVMASVSLCAPWVLAPYLSDIGFICGRVGDEFDNIVTLMNRAYELDSLAEIISQDHETSRDLGAD